MVKQPLVWVVVLNWNRPGDTLSCVTSLYKSDYSNLQVLVVDNGSTLTNFMALEASLPKEVEVIRSKVNLGFGQGNNLGIKYALERDASYILLINNDTVVHDRMVGQLVSAMEHNPSLGAVGPIIYYLDAPERVWFAGYRIPGNLFVLRRGLHLTPPLESVELVDFVSGCGILLRRKVLEQVKGFAPEYFMYYEDLDLCVRVKSWGWSIGCVTEAKMWHAVSASSGGAESPMKQYHQVRSSIIFYRQHTHGFYFILNLSLRLAHAGYSLIAYMVRGLLSGALLRQYVRGLQEGIQGR